MLSMELRVKEVTLNFVHNIVNGKTSQYLSQYFTQLTLY